MIVQLLRSHAKATMPPKGMWSKLMKFKNILTGQILFEMDGVSLLNAQKATALATHKLCLSTIAMYLHRK
jgi:ribosomal protein L16/L10AE